MPVFRTDEALWYRNGVFGDLGYAVPNYGDDVETLNPTIWEISDIVGRNVSAIMHHQDADARVPPSINTITRIHKLIIRARQIISSRAVPPGKPTFEPTHVTPAPQVFRIYPIPYFKVRSSWLRSYAQIALSCLSEMFQHTENRNSYDISTTFGGDVGQYLTRIYTRVAVELLQIPAATAADPAFIITDAQLAAYDPTKFFTSTELVDTVVPLDFVPTEDDLRVVTDGIPATQLINLERYPSGADQTPGQPVTATNAPAGSDGSTATTAATSTVAPFPPAPGP